MALQPDLVSYTSLVRAGAWAAALQVVLELSADLRADVIFMNAATGALEEASRWHLP